MSRQAADRVIRQIIAEAERVIDQKGKPQAQAARDLIRFLDDANAELGRKLARVRGNLDEKFTPAQATIFRYQITILTEYVGKRLSGLTQEQAQLAIVKGQQHAISHIGRLEEAFEGITTPLRIAAAAQVGAVGRPQTNLIVDRIPQSVDRYTAAMRQRFGAVIATGLASGATKRDMVRSLIGATRGGPSGEVSTAAVVLPNGTVERVRTENIPEGLFKRYEYWAERIVRTEVANAYNTSKLVALQEARNDLPDLKKKIIATFDNRTAYDSFYVHGQVRDVDKPFTDGAGRVYQNPPARPNDRETIIPWRTAWPDTSISAPKSDAEVNAVKSTLGPKARSASPTDNAAGPRAPSRGAGKPPPMMKWIREGLSEEELRRRAIAWAAQQRT